MSLSAPHSLQESATAKSMMKFSEALSDPTVLLTRGMRIVYANAEARMHFSNTSLLLHEPLQEFLAAAFPTVEWEPIEAAFNRILAVTEPEPVTIFLKHDLKQTHMRVTVLEFCCGKEESESLPEIAVTFFDPDPDGLLRRLEFVLDATTDGIFIVNRSNHIVYFNTACEQLTGWQRDAAVMQTYQCSNVLHCHNESGESMGSDHLCPAKVFFHRDSEPRPQEMLINTPGQREKWVETNYSPIKGPTGEVEFIVGIIRDIDERKRLETQLVQARNLASLGQLVSGIAHEIKNPLGVLMSAAEVVVNEQRPAEQRREAALYLKDEVRRLDDRVKDFLAFAHPKPLLTDEVDINSVLRKVIFSFSNLRHSLFDIEAKLNLNLPRTLADPDLLHQVFLNLTINAEQSMPDGGKLIITTLEQNGEIHILFTDHGTGIADEVRPKIFDPFFTTKKKGTGLGLSVVHQIITSHSARIDCRHNESGPGTTFEITLPVIKTEQKPA